MKPYFSMSQTIRRPVAEVFDIVIRLEGTPKEVRGLYSGSTNASKSVP
jgi:hypothetical protein